MKFLGLQRVDAMGYSLGGGVALQLTIRHPDLVRRLIECSAPFKRDGLYPEVRKAMEQMGPAQGEMMKQSPLSNTYPNVNWTALFTKLGALLSRDYDWSKEVSGIKAPTLLVFADSDAVRPEHIVEFYRLLGGGRRDTGSDGSGRSMNELAIVPGQTHYTLSAAPALATTVETFLDAVPMQAN